METTPQQKLYGMLVEMMANNLQYAVMIATIIKEGYTQKQMDNAIDVITNYAGRWRN